MGDNVQQARSWAAAFVCQPAQSQICYVFSESEEMRRGLSSGVAYTSCGEE